MIIVCQTHILTTTTKKEPAKQTRIGILMNSSDELSIKVAD